MKRQPGRVFGFISGCAFQHRGWWPSHINLVSVKLALSVWKNGKQAQTDPSVMGSCS